MKINQKERKLQCQIPPEAERILSVFHRKKRQKSPRKNREKRPEVTGPITAVRLRNQPAGAPVEDLPPHPSICGRQ